jgi:penicillin-binding protein 2
MRGVGPKLLGAALVLSLAACEPAATVQPSTLVPSPSPSPTLILRSHEETAAQFLAAYERLDYPSMYGYLSPGTCERVSVDDFSQRHGNAMAGATVITVTAAPQSALRQDDRAEVAFNLVLETGLVGSLEADVVMTLGLYDGEWLVEWDEGLIWPQLAGDRYFHMDYTIPARANIYDRSGLGLATEGQIVSVGVIPGAIEDEDALLDALETLLPLTREEIRDRYASAPPDWRVPVADITAAESIEQNELLSSFPAIFRETKEARTYPGGGVAPHLVGRIAPLPASQVDAYRARGYRGDEWVGITGLEQWGEEYLAGRHGGVLSIVSAEGEWVTTVAEEPALPSQPIATTFERGFQEQVQQILGERKGAIVVLDVNSGAVRALASGPGYDQNVFIGPTAGADSATVLSDPRNPLFNRATHGSYPLGSVFKIVTMAAGMEAAGMDPLETTFFCSGYWEGLGSAFGKSCWKTDGHGTIALQYGLTVSCDVVFYTVGQALHELDPEALPAYGDAFGFGQLTGLEGVVESEGLMPGPAWKRDTLDEPWWAGDTVNIAIGQGYMLVTPLQVARMMAAVANGGTLYRPFAVSRVGTGTGGLATQPQVVGQLPLEPENLQAIQEALLAVTASPVGTAYWSHVGLDIPVAGKTGTAEAPGPDPLPHSWFAAYAPADVPEIAIVVLVEHAGEGSTVAAPLTRQVIEAYYGLDLTPLPPGAEGAGVADIPAEEMGEVESDDAAAPSPDPQ